MKRLFCLFAVPVAMVSLTCASFAATVVFNGTTFAAPTWNRPVAGFGGLSGIGTATPYQAVTFTVDFTGSYDFSAVATNPSGWDNYSFIYTAFDPTQPLSNGVVGNDDFPGIGVTGFNGVPLSAGNFYTYVHTGFDNSSDGDYTLTVAGPGIFSAVSAVPEPGSTAAIALLLAAPLCVRIRRK